jgi:hypothetical protein
VLDIKCSKEGQRSSPWRVGRIREVGDHQLLSGGGLYSQLYRRQIELAAVGEGEAGEE